MFTLENSLYRGLSTAVLLLLLLGVGAWGQAPTPVKARILVEPSYAKLFLVDSEGRLDEQMANDVIYLDQEKTVDGKFHFRVVVPRWGVDVPDGGDQEKTDYAWDLKPSVPKRDIETLTDFPSDGTVLEVPLSFTERFSAWTKNRPVAALVTFVLILSAILSSLFHRKSLVRAFARMAGTLDEVAQVVTGYELQEKLGEGGMGEVWSAVSESGQPVAIKFLRKELGSDPEYRKRFEREIKACIPLDHPSLLHLYGYGDATDGRMYTVSELLLGQTLKATISSGVENPPELAARVLDQVGDALFDLHSRGLVHRDVKPDNIFCCQDGKLKLLDMGLVHGDGLTELTQTGQVLGTPAYLAPDQMMGHPTAASDQYSLGIILYEILVGQRPFIQPNRQMLAYQHQAVPPQPLSELEAQVTPEVELGVLRMLEKKPEDRYPSLSEAQEALASQLTHLVWERQEATINANIEDFTSPS